MLIRIDIKMTLAVFFHAVFADTAKAIETFYKMSSCFAKKSLLSSAGHYIRILELKSQKRKVIMFSQLRYTTQQAKSVNGKLSFVIRKEKRKLLSANQ